MRRTCRRRRTARSSGRTTLLAKTPFGRNLTTDEEREEWDNDLRPITET